MIVETDHQSMDANTLKSGLIELPQYKISR